MRPLMSIVLTAFLALTVMHPQADDTVTSERLQVGKTKINCVMEPCPWRGVVRNGEGLGGLIWAGPHLPQLVARPEDASQIKAGWDGDGCLEIEGRMADEVLQVDRIIGECR